MHAHALRLSGDSPTPTQMAAKKRSTSEAGKAASLVFAKRLRAWREHQEETQLGLAYRAKMALETIRQYEAGRRTPRISEVADLALALGVQMEILMFRDPPTEAAATTNPHGR